MQPFLGRKPASDHSPAAAARRPRPWVAVALAGAGAQAHTRPLLAPEGVVQPYTVAGMCRSGKERSSRCQSACDDRQGPGDLELDLRTLLHHHLQSRARSAQPRLLPFPPPLLRSLASTLSMSSRHLLCSYIWICFLDSSSFFWKKNYLSSSRHFFLQRKSITHKLDIP